MTSKAKERLLMMDSLIFDKIHVIPSLRKKYYNTLLNFMGPETIKNTSLKDLGFVHDKETLISKGYDLDHVPERMTLMDKIVGILLGEYNAPNNEKRRFLAQGYPIDEAVVEEAADFVHREKEDFFTAFSIPANSRFRTLGDDKTSKFKLLNHILLLWGFSFIGSNNVGERRVCCSIDGLHLSEIYTDVAKRHLGISLPPMSLPPML
jgi:hypothetical protein